MDQDKIFLFGAGGHAKVVMDLVDKGGVLQVAFLVDDDPGRRGRELAGCTVLGDRQDLLDRPEWVGGRGIVCVGNNRQRSGIAAWLVEHGFSLVPAVHPAAILARGVEVGAGTVVMAGAVVNADSVVGENGIINTGVIIEHDCRIGEHAHVGPGAVLCGNTRVGPGAFVGAGATLVPDIVVGRDAVIGAGSTVIRDVPAGVTVAGNPATVLAG